MALAVFFNYHERCVIFFFPFTCVVASMMRPRVIRKPEENQVHLLPKTQLNDWLDLMVAPLPALAPELYPMEKILAHHGFMRKLDQLRAVARRYINASESKGMKKSVQIQPMKTVIQTKSFVEFRADFLKTLGIRRPVPLADLVFIYFEVNQDPDQFLTFPEDVHRALAQQYITFEPEEEEAGSDEEDEEGEEEEEHEGDEGSDDDTSANNKQRDETGKKKESTESDKDTSTEVKVVNFRQ